MIGVEVESLFNLYDDENDKVANFIWVRRPIFWFAIVDEFVFARQALAALYKTLFVMCINRKRQCTYSLLTCPPRINQLSNLLSSSVYCAALIGWSGGQYSALTVSVLTLIL